MIRYNVGTRGQRKEMNIVYVTQENPKLNYADAERFGQVMFLTDQDHSPNRNSIRNQKRMTDIKGTLKSFDVDRDSLLLSGDPINIGIAFQIVSGIAVACGKPFKLLKWDGLGQCYYQIVINPLSWSSV